MSHGAIKKKKLKFMLLSERSQSEKPACVPTHRMIFCGDSQKAVVAQVGGGGEGWRGETEIIQMIFRAVKLCRGIL